MQIAILTFEGFNELDSFVAAGILNRMTPKGWAVYITSPTPEVTSKGGVTLRRQKPLSFLAEADAVLIGSGTRARDHAVDHNFLPQLAVDPSRQLVGAQCSGTLLLAGLGLIGDLPACTDATTRPWVAAAGAMVVNAPFAANGSVATACGCLASQYLAAWTIARLATPRDAEEAIGSVAPAGQKAEYVERAMGAITPFLGDGRSLAPRRSASNPTLLAASLRQRDGRRPWAALEQPPEIPPAGGLPAPFVARLPQTPLGGDAICPEQLAAPAPTCPRGGEGPPPGLLGPLRTERPALP